jgi:predicted ATPase
MLTIQYDPVWGSTFPDSRLESIVSGWIKSSKIADLYIPVGSDSLVQTVRLMIYRGVISHEEVVFKFVDENGNSFAMYSNKEGLLDHWPVGFCDQNENQLLEMMGWK